MLIYSFCVVAAFFVAFFLLICAITFFLTIVAFVDIFVCTCFAVSFDLPVSFLAHFVTLMH